MKNFRDLRDLANLECSHCHKEKLNRDQYRTIELVDDSNLYNGYRLTLCENCLNDHIEQVNDGKRKGLNLQCDSCFEFQSMNDMRVGWSDEKINYDAVYCSECAEKILNESSVSEIA